MVQYFIIEVEGRNTAYPGKYRGVSSRAQLADDFLDVLAKSVRRSGICEVGIVELDPVHKTLERVPLNVLASTSVSHPFRFISE